MKDNLFLENGIEESLKYEIQLLYEIGVKIDDIEYLLSIKTKTTLKSS